MRLQRLDRIGKGVSTCGFLLGLGRAAWSGSDTVGETWVEVYFHLVGSMGDEWI